MTALKLKSRHLDRYWQKSVTLFDLAKLRAELERTNREIEQEDFWNNLEYAQKVMREKKNMEDTLAEYEGLEKSLNDVSELIELAEMEEEGGAGQEELAVMAIPSMPRSYMAVSAADAEV